MIFVGHVGDIVGRRAQGVEGGELRGFVSSVLALVLEIFAQFTAAATGQGCR